MWRVTKRVACLSLRSKQRFIYGMLQDESSTEIVWTNMDLQNMKGSQGPCCSLISMTMSGNISITKYGTTLAHLRSQFRSTCI